jgi:type VI secretion system protein VasG
MITNNIKALIGKLGTESRKAAEAAAQLAVSRGNYEVDLEHLLLKLLDNQNGDVASILRQYSVDRSRLQRDLTQAMEALKKGHSRTPVFAQNLLHLFETAWVLSSLEYHDDEVRSGHLILAAATDHGIARTVGAISSEWKKVSSDDLHRNFVALTTHSNESRAKTRVASPVDQIESTASQGEGKANTPGLDQYTISLTARARQENIDPILGRDAEIRQMVDILMRRRQNNPILTGEAGVGKTAVVEGLAQRIVAEDVPPTLLGVAIHTLDLGLLQAGASVKGEFENRLRMVMDEVKRSPHPIILFIDEAHTMIGAGGQAGQSDAANLLKPALARGELRTIAATTWSEYKKYFEKDAALARRFQVVKVDEPSEEKAKVMMRGLVCMMEAHHKIRILDEAVDAAVRLSARYLSGRQLPDKSVSVMDTACARVAISQHATPGLIEDLNRHIQSIETELNALRKEVAAGAEHGDRIKVLRQEQSASNRKLKSANERWEKEKVLARKFWELRSTLEGAAPNDQATSDQKPAQRSKKITDDNSLEGIVAELRALQGEEPLVHVQVDEQIIGEVISGWTGIPLGKMVKNEIKTVLSLKTLLKERVVGQDAALEAITKRIQTARANLEDPSKPKGVFLLVGPSGVGKTETALALADILYGGERNLITINMSEFQEAHSVSSLKGSPPGYVGYGEGGVLTEAVRRKPYSVLLLDEIEKAHPDVMELFYQVFDKGIMDDAEGREIDFKNTVIILTSNVGTQTIMRVIQAEGKKVTSEQLSEKLRPELQAKFKPAFLGRVATVPYFPVQDDVLKQITRLKLSRIAQRIAENHKAKLEYGNELIDGIAARCTEVDTGARNIDYILTGTLLPQVSEAVLNRMSNGETISKIIVSVDKKTKDFRYRVV